MITTARNRPHAVVVQCNYCGGTIGSSMKTRSNGIGYAIPDARKNAYSRGCVCARMGRDPQEIDAVHFCADCAAMLKTPGNEWKIKNVPAMR